MLRGELLGGLLRDELERRRSRNRRYSLRAFARDLDVHHATLSRVLRGRQRVTAGTLAAWACRLGWADDTVQRSALSQTEGAVLGAVARPGFQPSSRWLASVTGIPLDEVNASIHRLLRTGRLRLESASVWVARP